MDLRIAICTPVRALTAGYAWGLAEMVRCFLRAPYEGGSHDCATFIASGSILLEQRQRCVVEATKYDATHILWLDSDMKVPHDTIQALLRHGLPVVGANYGRTNVPSIPTAYRDDDEFTGPVYTREDSTGLEEVAHCGMGCLLTDIRVFDQITLPYFLFEPARQGAKFRGEDVYFLGKLREKGIPTYIDHDLSKKVAHIGQFEWTYDVCARNDEALLQVTRNYREDAA